MVAVEVGRVCVKLAGRDAGGKCVIVDVLDDKNVLVDGEKVRRRKVNVNHLQILEQSVEVEKNASTDVVVKALKSIESPA